MAAESIFFWKPEEKPHGYMSQWHPSRFIKTTTDFSGATASITYENAEQYMMHHKGRLFAPDSAVTASILDGGNLEPKKIKALGQKVPNFDDKIWNAEKYQIVVDGNYLKFTQDEELKAQLLETGDKELVEASPYDRIWGIGFRATEAPEQRQNWGSNLLGKAIMEVRDRIRNEDH